MNILTRVVSATALLLITILFVWVQSDLHEHPGDILADAITDPNDRFMVQYEEVKELGFYGDDFIAVALTGEKLTTEFLRQYKKLGRRLEAKIPGAHFNLWTIPNLEVKEDGSLSIYPYLQPNGKHRPKRIEQSFDKDELMRDILFKIDEQGVILVHLIITEPGVTESELYDAVKSVLEERTVDSTERLFTYDIHPTEKWQNAWILGWPLGRREVSQMLPTENVRFVSLGVLLVFFLFYLNTKSLRLSLLGTLVIGCGLVWMRGMIPVVDWFTLFKERAYIIIGAANTLVVGSSLVLATFWWLREKQPEDRKLLARLILIAVIIGCGNQISLFMSFDIRAIEELAWYGLFGMVACLLLAWYGIRALVTTVPDDEERDGRFVRAVQNLVERSRGHQPKAWLAGTLIIASVVGAVLCFPFIPRGTNALGLIHGTRIAESFQQMEARGLWADGIELAVTPQSQNDGIPAYHDPKFLAEATRFYHEIEALDGTRVVGTILKQVEELTNGYYGHSVPQTKKEAQRVFLEMKNAGLPYGVPESFYNEKGFQLFVLQKRVGTSEEQMLSRVEIEAIATTFPSLNILFGGTSVRYARTAELVVNGKIWNLVTQTPWNWLGFVVAIWWLNGLFVQWGYTRGQVSAWRMATVMTIPFVFATGTFMMFMAVWGIRLDQGNAAILNMAANAAVDFTLYWGGKYALEVARTGNSVYATLETFRSKGEHVAMDVVVNCACFVPLYLSGFKTIGELGWQVPAMLILVGIGVIFLTTPFFGWCVVKDKTD